MAGIGTFHVFVPTPFFVKNGASGAVLPKPVRLLANCCPNWFSFTGALPHFSGAGCSRYLRHPQRGGGGIGWTACVLL